MNKKILIFIAVLTIFLVGSFVSMVSSSRTNQETSESCLDDCENCESNCNDSNNCNSQETKNCDGSGACSQNEQKGNCKSNTGCSGSCKK